MAWVVKNNLSRADLRVRSFLWTSEKIKIRSEYKSELGGGGNFDITLEGVSGYLLEFLTNATLLYTTVSSRKNTVVSVNDGGVSRNKQTVKIHITDNEGRNERHEVEVDLAK